MMMQAKTGVMRLQATECRGLLGTPEARRASRRNRPCPHLAFRLLASDCERTHVCGRKAPSVCCLVTEPWETNTPHESHPILSSTPSGLARRESSSSLRLYSPNISRGPQGGVT